VNGQVAASAEAQDPLRVEFRGEVDVPEGGWVAARVLGPSSRYVSDSYAFAHTSPVYLVRDGRTYRSAEDARFLAEAVEAVWQRADRGPWSSQEARARFKDVIDQALAVYRKITHE
jgi:hypothetical protein